MAKLLSGRQPQIQVGISSYTEDKTTLNVVGKVGIGTTNAKTNLDIIGNVNVSGVVTATNFYGDGSALTGINVSAAPAGSDGQVQYNNSGSTGGANDFYYDDINNRVGIGTTNPTSKLSVVGDGNFTGVVTAVQFIGTASTASFATTAFTLNGVTEPNLSVGFAQTAGVATYSTNAGIATYATYATSAGIATYADTAGIATNATYATNSGIATYATNAGIATYADTAGIATNATYATNSGIATYATNAGIASYATSAGIATNATYASNAGIATYATNAGVATYASNAGIATYATNAGIATYASTAGVATALQNARTFEITGDIIASPISFNGTGNVSLAATIQPNSVALGSDTTGDYVSNITGTSNQITVTSGTGESSTPTLSFPNQVTIPQDLTVTRDVQINRNLNVDGNITIGGTTATLFTTELKIFDPDIVLGFRTDALGNDISNDTTSNHGGVALASTEGTPLVQLFIAGIETNPATYKKIMWFKSGTFAGLGTDAWLSNYAVGIGSTQFPIGTRLAAGNVQFTQSDLAVVENINASGIITSSGFSGNLTGTAATITTLSSTNGIFTNLTGTAGTVTSLNVVSTLNALSGVITNISGTNLNYSGIGTIANLTGTNVNLSGIITASGGFNIGIQSGGLNVTTGVITALNFVGSGNTFNYNPATKVIDISISGGTTVSIGTSPPTSPTVGSLWYNTNRARTFIYYGDGDSFQWVDAAPFNFGETTNTNIPSEKWAETTVGIHTLSNVGIGTTNPTSKLTVVGDARVSGVVTATSFSGSGTNLTGIVTSILAGSNITITSSTGQITISASGGGGVSDWRDNSLF